METKIQYMKYIPHFGEIVGGWYVIFYHYCNLVCVPLWLHSLLTHVYFS